MIVEYIQSGTKQIDDSLELKDFTWYIREAAHNLEEETSWVEVICYEIHQRHSRTLTIPTPEVWTQENVFLEVLKLPAFAGSKPKE